MPEEVRFWSVVLTLGKTSSFWRGDELLTSASPASSDRTFFLRDIILSFPFLSLLFSLVLVWGDVVFSFSPSSSFDNNRKKKIKKTQLDWLTSSTLFFLFFFFWSKKMRLSHSFIIRNRTIIIGTGKDKRKERLRSIHQEPVLIVVLRR
jgi:hypothetical protein